MTVRITMEAITEHTMQTGIHMIRTEAEIIINKL
jgi:hypothetical protein